MKFFLVEDIFTKTGSDAAQVGDIIGVFLERFHLFIEEFFFKIIGQMRITATANDERKYGRSGRLLVLARKRMQFQ